MDGNTGDGTDGFGRKVKDHPLVGMLFPFLLLCCKTHQVWDDRARGGPERPRVGGHLVHPLVVHRLPSGEINVDRRDRNSLQLELVGTGKRRGQPEIRILPLGQRDGER